jgi:hypothetical protein
VGSEYSLFEGLIGCLEDKAFTQNLKFHSFWYISAFNVYSSRHTEYVPVGMYKCLSPFCPSLPKEMMTEEIALCLHTFNLIFKHVRSVRCVVCVGLKELIYCSWNWIEIVHSMMEC